MITKTLVREGRVGNKTGYCFEVYWNGRPYPNLVSSLVKTEKGAKRRLTQYLNTGEFSIYGDAE